jgi:hypothetical protein
MVESHFSSMISELFGRRACKRTTGQMWGGVRKSKYCVIIPCMAGGDRQGFQRILRKKLQQLSRSEPEALISLIEYLQVIMVSLEHRIENSNASKRPTAALVTSRRRATGIAHACIGHGRSPRARREAGSVTGARHRRWSRVPTRRSPRRPIARSPLLAPAFP